MAEAKLKVGSRAPEFEAFDDHGQVVRLSDVLQGGHVVLYFYPKDHTPGCTIEARAFNAALKEFQKRKTQILGVSTDSVDSHGKFRRSCNLQYRLVADTEGRIAHAYGAIGGLLGLLGITRRMTVLIDKKGTVRAVWTKVNPRDHPKEVLDMIDKMGLK
jgi:peroxiredoxin Q/BCP